MMIILIITTIIIIIIIIIIVMIMVMINDNDDNNINNNRIKFFLFIYFFFLQSPRCPVNCHQHARSKFYGQGVLVCKSRATHRALMTCNICAKWYDDWLVFGCLLNVPATC